MDYKRMGWLMLAGVLAFLNGQMLSFADDQAASGATAVQDAPETGDGGQESGAEDAENTDQAEEASDGQENASQGDSGEKASPPSDSQAFEG